MENFLARRVPDDDDQEWDLARHGDIILRNSGTISLVYFPLTAQRMDLSEIELIYPGLLRGLEEHPGLGLVLGRQDGQAMAMTVRGPRHLNDLQRPVDPRPAGQPARQGAGSPATHPVALLPLVRRSGGVWSLEQPRPDDSLRAALGDPRWAGRRAKPPLHPAAAGDLVGYDRNHRPEATVSAVDGAVRGT